MNPFTLRPQARIHSTVYSPTPIRPIVPNINRPTLFSAVSFTEIPPLENPMRPQRPYKSLAEKIDSLDLSNVQSESSENSIEQRLNIERLSSPDFLEDLSFGEELQPPVRAQNPQIYDEEFIKMDKTKFQKSAKLAFQLNQTVLQPRELQL